MKKKLLMLTVILTTSITTNAQTIYNATDCDITVEAWCYDCTTCQMLNVLPPAMISYPIGGQQHVTMTSSPCDGFTGVVLANPCVAYRVIVGSCVSDFATPGGGCYPKDVSMSPFGCGSCLNQLYTVQLLTDFPNPGDIYIAN